MLAYKVWANVILLTNSLSSPMNAAWKKEAAALLCVPMFKEQPWITFSKASLLFSVRWRQQRYLLKYTKGSFLISPWFEWAQSLKTLQKAKVHSGFLSAQQAAGCSLVAYMWMFLIRFLIIVLLWLLPSVIHPQSLALLTDDWYVKSQ